MNIAFSLFAMLNYSVEPQHISDEMNTERTLISIDGNTFYVFELKDDTIYSMDFQVTKPACNKSVRLFIKIEQRKIKYEGYVVNHEIILQIIAKYLFDSGQVDSIEYEYAPGKIRK